LATASSILPAIAPAEPCPSGLLIGGQWQVSGGGRRFPVQNPATGELIGEVSDADGEDAMVALAAAHAAQAGWAQVAPRARAEVLQRAFERLTAESEKFASIIALESGKPMAEARGEVAYAAEYLRWFSEEAVRIHGRYQVAPTGSIRHLVSRRPIGVCLLVTPWNFPLAMVARKVAPAIAAGCAMIVKPSELTPGTATAFAALVEASGLPPGVLNALPTTRADAVVGALLGDPRVRKLSFTGSTRIGQLLLARTAANVQRCSLELGGNAPFLVFEDADLDAAVEGAVQAKLRNAGQACTAANRFLVHETIGYEFIKRLAHRFEAERASGCLGPLITGSARERVHALVSDAVARGAQVVTGGTLPSGPGYFYPPTILTAVAPSARITGEEIFGPVATVEFFSSDREAVSAANETPYGLAAYAFTADLGRALWVQEVLEAGMVGINTGMVSDPVAPFGGVKHSGFGREGGVEGIDEYLSVHYAAVDSRGSRFREPDRSLAAVNE
jgi:succinate-semialdehyde dehydrogenase / glutarate-semialdehyde dehydrogenase